MTALTPEQREEYHRLAVECLTIYNPDDPEAKVARYALDQTAKLEAALAALWKIHGREWAAGDTKAGARHASDMWAIADLALQKPLVASLPASAPTKTADEMVTDSCGCVFCDLDIPRLVATIDMAYYHATASQFVPCTKSPAPQDEKGR